MSGQKTQEQCNVNLNKFIKRAHLSGRNDYIYLLQAVLIVTAVSYVFYDSLIPVIIFSPYVIYHIKKQRFNERYQKDNELIRQFRDGMQAVSFALNTGYSIENSFAEALQELVMLYGQNAVIVADFNMIVNRIRRNENLEDILDDYAASTNLDDIKYFAEIFRYAKRSGGDVIGIIKQTSHIIHEKAEVQQQIDTIITGKRLEQQAVCTGRSCHTVIFSKCAFLHRISWLIIFKKGGKIRFTRRKKKMECIVLCGQSITTGI